MSRPESPTASNDDADRVVHLTGRDVRDAARLFQLLSGAEAQLAGITPSGDLTPDARERPDEQDLLARAKLILGSRRLRERYFAPSIFGEPAWDILLVLFITDTCGGRQTLGRLADWINTPPTTVLRWVSYLEREKLVERQPHPTDRRTTFLRLLPRGREAMTDYLTAVPG
jgi:DNA-binding MarR family transcriptional regulator